MKTIFSIFFLAGFACSSFGQERVLDKAIFDNVFNTSYQIWTVWKGKAFRKSVIVERGAPNNNSKLSRVVEFDGKGASRALYNEYVEGREQRLTREVIGYGDANYIRDLGRGNWSVRRDPKREESHTHLAYAPDPLEVQAVRSHFVRSQFDRTQIVNTYAFVGTETYQKLREQRLPNDGANKGYRKEKRSSHGDRGGHEVLVRTGRNDAEIRVHVERPSRIGSVLPEDRSDMGT
ncbi:MAG: hypothetical protein ABI857_04300 [Acidobacteriota bacterium]